MDYSQQIALIVEAVREATNEIVETQQRQRAPHVLMSTVLTRDAINNVWHCRYVKQGTLVNGIVGTGKTPAEACAAFDRVWESGKS